MSNSDVLIIGAGPTGLVLALWLTRMGVRVRIVDQAPTSGQTSRAVGVQARTLELYRQMDLASPLVEGGLPGAVRGGDRLPWVPGGAGSDNFEPLASLDWQVHVYGDPASSLRQACDSRRLPLKVFPWEGRAAKAGLARDAAYLVRPDGYVGFAVDSPAAPERLAGYLDARGVRPATA